MKTHFQPDSIEARLSAVRGRIRGAQRARGLMVLATIALGGLFILMALDLIFSPLPVVLRWLMTAAWAGAVVVAAVVGSRPLLKPIGLLQVARWLEGRHPEMEERLSTVLELSRSDEGVAAGLLESLARAAEADIQTVDAGVEVNRARTSRRWARPAIALLGLLGLVFAIWPQEASRLLVRAVVPFSDAGNVAAGKFTLSPGDQEVLAGDPVRIEVTYDGAAHRPEIHLELETGKKLTQPMLKSAEGHHYLMDPARASFRYRVQAGRDESDSHTITVWPLPEIAEARVTLDLPRYTGETAQEFPLDRKIDAVTGTRVTLTGRLNTAVAAAWLEIDSKTVAEGQVQNSATMGQVTLSWVLNEGGSGEAQVNLKHRLGHEITALRFAVQVLADEAPQVVLLSPVQREFKVRPDDVVRMRYEVTEDFSVAKVALEVAVENPATSALFEESLPSRVPLSEPKVFSGAMEPALGSLLSSFPGAGTLRLRVRAEDARPAESGGPGVGVSEWLTLHLDSAAPALAQQQLREEHEGAKRTLEEAQRAIRESRERMDHQRGEIKKPELSEKSHDELEKAAQKLAEAQEKLATLAKQMQETVHAQKSEAVQQAAEAVSEAHAALEDSQLHDAPEQREAALDAARDQAREIEKQLEQMRQALDQDRGKIEDLARLMALAQQQQELAREAKQDAAEAASTETLPAAWKDRQRQVENQLKQQLRERPEGKANALQNQSEQATELAVEAQAAAEVQAMLEHQARDLSPQALQQALTAEQAKIAQEVQAELAQAQQQRNHLADPLSEVAAAANDAHQQLEKGDLQAANTSAAEAAAALSEAAQKSPELATPMDSLPALATRQQQVAAALDALAQGKPAEAMKAVQAAHAEQASQLADAIARLPQLDGNGAAEEARHTAQRASQHAEQAAHKGSEGALAEAAQPHHEASQNFEKAAQSLTQAAAEFAQGAQEMAGHSPDPQRAAVPPSDLADAFQEASQAASAPTAGESAMRAERAAAALAQATEASRQQLQGKGPGPASPAPPVSDPGMTPGNEPQATPRAPEADPGVPPELAKLGISSEDWAKIQSSLKSGVGAAGNESVPAEYRSLVRGYFESMTQKPAEK